MTLGSTFILVGYDISFSTKELSNNITLIVEIGVGIIITTVVIIISKRTEEKMDKKIETILNSVKEENYQKALMQKDQTRNALFQIEIIEGKLHWLISMIKNSNKMKSADEQNLDLLDAHVQLIDKNFQILRDLDDFNSVNFDIKIIRRISDLHATLHIKPKVENGIIEFEKFESIHSSINEVILIVQNKIKEYDEIILKSQKDLKIR